MFGWLKRLVRSGHQETSTATPLAPDNVIEAWIEDRWTPCRAIAARGLMLVCSSRSARGAMRTFTVNAGDARSLDTFWEVWRRFSGNVQLVWEDGTEWTPDA